MSDERDDALHPPDPSGADGGKGDTEEPDPTALVGEILAGRYRIIRRLGVGAMGAVYLGEHMRIGRKDAIKVLRASMARDPEAIARFTRGARNVSRIRHPNVCTLYDFGNTEEGFHFLAMEYVDGPSLGGLLEKQGALSLERATELNRQVGEALYAAHSLGIVHRDLKPDNIMVARERDGSEKVKVVDFDIARGPAEDEGPAVTRHGFVVGTPEYMSPEQLTGDPLDGRSDIYSMALVLFRILTDRLPFDGKTAQEIMVQRLTRDPMTLAEATGRQFPEALESAVAQALRRKAAERPADAREFARNVTRAVEAAGPLAPASSDADAGGGEGVTPPPPTVAPSASATGGFEPRDPSPEAPPGTKVADAAAEGGESGSRSRMVALLAGLGAVMVLFVGGGLLAASLWFGWIGGSDEPVAGPDVEDPPAQVADADGLDPDPPPPGIDEAAADSPVESPEEDAPAETREAAPPTAVEEATPPASDPAPTPEQDPPPGVVLEITPAEVRNFVYQQYLGTDPGELPATADARRSHLEAIRDTVDAVWRMEGVSQEDRAFTAFVLGETFRPLGDSVRALEWFEEAVRLDPIELYINHRDAMRGDGG